MRELLIALVGVFASGCASLEPNAIPVELTHVSHATQHFTKNPTNFGYEAFSVGAKWIPSPGWSLKVEEGVVLNPTEHSYTRRYGLQPIHGDLLGPREIFTATLTYEFQLK